MQGHIRKRGKNCWAVVLDVGRDESGKRVQKWHSVKGGKRQAEKELTRLLHDLNTCSYVAPSNQTVGRFLDQWLDNAARQTVSAKTFERYSELVHGHIAPALGNRELCRLRPLDISNFYSRSLDSGRKDGRGGLSAQTVLHLHRLLHTAFAQAVKWGLLA